MANEIPSEFLAQTPQDAIRVTRKLGIRYLWIDAMCIIQDDDDDKVVELQSMRSIYENSTVTLFAKSSANAVAGFTNVDPPDGCLLPFYMPDGSFGSVMAVPSQICLPGVLGWPAPLLDTRGWAFQERILPKRLLIFQDGELKWQCLSSMPGRSHSSKFEDMDYENEGSNKSQSESDSDTSESSYSDLEDQQVNFSESLTPISIEAPPTGFLHQPAACFSLSRKNLRGDSLWADIVREFSLRAFTIYEDGLPGIAGIIQRLEESWHDTCVAGLWESRLVQDLYWTIEVEDGDYPFQKDTERHINSKMLGVPPTSMSNSRRGWGRWKWWDKAIADSQQRLRNTTQPEIIIPWRRCEKYFAPSWSWLSIPGQISLGGEELYPKASIVKYSLESPTPATRLFQLTGGKVVLRAKILNNPYQTPVVRETYDEEDMVDFQGMTRRPPGIGSIVYASLGKLGIIPKANMEFYPNNHAGLMLVRSNYGGAQSETFMRVGTFAPVRPIGGDSGDNDWAKHWTEERISKENQKRAREWEEAAESIITII